MAILKINRNNDKTEKVNIQQVTDYLNEHGEKMTRPRVNFKLLCSPEGIWTKDYVFKRGY